MVAGEGFEPSQTESESVVLPLHNPAKRIHYYTNFPRFVKDFFRGFHFFAISAEKRAREARRAGGLRVFPGGLPRRGSL